MESTWALANFLWGYMMICGVVLFVYDWMKTPEQKKQETEMAKAHYEKQRLARKIVEVRPLGVIGTQFKRGGLGGAMFGGLIGGFPGACVGGMLRSGKAVLVVRFAVKYGDGQVKLRDCMYGSREYKMLMKHVKKRTGTEYSLRH